MAVRPVYATTPKLGIANFSAANTNRDGSGSIQPLFIAGASGSKLKRIEVKAEDDFADGIVILWLRTGSAAAWMLWKEIDTGDGTNASNTDPGYEYTLGVMDRDYDLPASYELGCTITVAPTTGDCNVFAWASDY